MMDMITGKIDETELESLAGEEIVGGATWTVVLTALIVATYAAGACPTACTESCNK